MVGRIESMLTKLLVLCKGILKNVKIKSAKKGLSKGGCILGRRAE